MRLFTAIFLCLACAVSALFAQQQQQQESESEKIQFRGLFDFDNPSEQILAYKFLDGGQKLQLVGARSFQLWDVGARKVLEARKHEIENLDQISFGAASPDGNKILVLGGEDQEKKPFPATVWDASGKSKRLAVLDKATRPIKSAVWSKNGATLVTASDLSLRTMPIYEKRTEFCFWDGETLEFRACTVLTDVTWRYLSDDGERLFTTSVPLKSGFFGIPLPSGTAKFINIRNTRDARNDRNLSVDPTGSDEFRTLSWKLMPSPDGKYFAIVAKSREADENHRVVVWQISDLPEQFPKYTLRANPKIRDSRIEYSPDGKYFALDAGKIVQIYELETGRKIHELTASRVPDVWLDDNKIALYYGADEIKAFDISGGNQVFVEKVAYETVERVIGSTTDSNGNYQQQTETEVVDWTRIRPRPVKGEYFLAYSNETAKVYDSRTGTNLQTLVAPPLRFEKKKKILGIPLPTLLRQRNLVREAEWSADGRYILVFDGDKISVSIWEIGS